MKPKIALVANTAWNLHHFRRPLIRRLLADGCEVLLLAAADEYADALQDLPGVRFLPLRNLYPQSKNPWQELRLLRELYCIYRRERPALILHYTIKPNLYGSLAAGRLGIPCIATVTGLGYTFINPSPGHRLIRQLYRLAFRRCARVVFQNPDDRQLFLDRRLVDPDRTVLIRGSGVDTDHFRPLDKPDPAGPFVFLFTGRLLYDKGIREFCEAARQLQRPDVAFWVLGEEQFDHPNGVPKEVLDAWIQSGEIRYLGYQADVRPVLAQADVFVLPSYREGLPRAVLEAMAMGKPILTTDAPGCRETVEEGRNGFLVPVRVVEELAQGMGKMLAMDRSQLQAMGAESRSKVEREFSEKLIVRSYLILIEQINTSVST